MSFDFIPTQSKDMAKLTNYFYIILVSFCYLQQLKNSRKLLKYLRRSSRDWVTLGRIYAYIFTSRRMFEQILHNSHIVNESFATLTPQMTNETKY